MTWNYATIIEKVKDMAETRGLQLVSRKPTHPGEVLREEFMPDFGLSVAQLAQRLGVSRQSMNELVHERRAVQLRHGLALGPPVRHVAPILVEPAAQRRPVGFARPQPGGHRAHRAAGLGGRGIGRRAGTLRELLAAGAPKRADGAGRQADGRPGPATWTCDLCLGPKRTWTPLVVHVRSRKSKRTGPAAYPCATASSSSSSREASTGTPAGSSAGSFRVR